jgi:hypothetical protein
MKPSTGATAATWTDASSTWTGASATLTGASSTWTGAPTLAGVRELASLSSPWYFSAVPKDNASVYAPSWDTAFDANGLGGPYGLRTAEKRAEGYTCAKMGCCRCGQSRRQLRWCEDRPHPSLTPLSAPPSLPPPLPPPRSVCAGGMAPSGPSRPARHSPRSSTSSTTTRRVWRPAPPHHSTAASSGCCSPSTRSPTRKNG